MTGRKPETALGVARARFIDGLPRKAKELKGAIALLTASPGADRPREEMRRRLHALYASAQVFRIEPLASALREGIARLDAARDETRELNQDELDSLANLAGTLPSLAAGGFDENEPSVVGPIPGWTPQEGVEGARSDEFERPTAPPPPGLRISEAPAATDGTPTRKQEPLPEAPSSPSRIPAPPPPSRIPAPPPPPSVRAPTPPTGSARAPAPTPTMGSVRAPSGPLRRPTPPSGVPRQNPFSGPPPRSASDTVLSVVVVASEDVQAEVRAGLPAERFEILTTTDEDEALRLARTAAPDVVLVDAKLVAGASDSFVAKLRRDPLADFVPVVAVRDASTRLDPITARQKGIDEVVARPLDPRRLERVIERLAGIGPDEPLPALGDVSVTQVADRIAEEVRRGLVDSLDQGDDVTVPLGEGSEVLAAAWATVARVRAHLADRSSGKVRFRDAPLRGGPALVALTDEEGEGIDDAEDVSLNGRRLIVADDDPAVRWFFAGLFREAGADVVEAEDGEHALAEARRVRPDAILSDILMPHLDGLGLCRAIQRDPALCEVPVILLSWKEDFLQRMRELKAGAQGYLRKEAAASQILARVKLVLRPRARLETRLRAGGEVRGHVEGVGVVPLVQIVAKERPDSRLSVRDAASLFELDLRGGHLVEVTATASDGSFLRGRKALDRLVGVVAGRFFVADAEAGTAGRPAPERTLDAELDEASRRLGAVIDAVSAEGLGAVAQLKLDDESLEAALGASPAGVRDLVAHLRKAKRPRDLLVAGVAPADVIEATLVDLARRGVIREVRGVTGEDRIAKCFEARGGARSESVIERPVSVPPPAGVFKDRAPQVEAPKRAPEPPPKAQALAAPPPRRDDEPSPGGVVVTPSRPPASVPAGAIASKPPEAMLKPSIGYTLTLYVGGALALAALGFFGWRAFAPGMHHTTTTQTETVATAPPAEVPPPAAEVPLEPVADPSGSVPFGHDVVGIAAEGLEVAPGQGAVVFEIAEGVRAGLVRIDGQPMGEHGVKVAIPPGPHEITVEDGDSTHFGYFALPAGHTRRIDWPLP